MRERGLGEDFVAPVELERAVTKLGHRGCGVSAGVVGRTLDHPDFASYDLTSLLVGSEGTVHGVLAVYAREPRSWREEEIDAIAALVADKFNEEGV